ncbi:hypothetical protein Osc7112_0206 [Oscillatoria nigro-viridis PCC 7112]|uniref:Uncharacterized protein n=1 Tax=Phormidium nigroviride PCC 7112 TaxID=179408 RepID=K9VAX0_9CYAN|nr:hypothetical protein [Oscillatoria nigro-viridis]AFZ04839.1 hypothetical protein Osc7112_0206 [Oscillatoria nigro-viridis PCC 7112]
MAINLNLGIDFGTKFTKVCVRDADRERSWVITFTNGSPNLDEALLPTKIGICSNGSLLAGLTESEWKTQPQTHIDVDFIKMRLANIDLAQEGEGYSFDSLPNFHNSDLNTPENLENISAYYLSRVILKAMTWVIRNNADLVKGQKISWSINIGVPVKYFDSNAINRFRQVLSWACLLSESHPESLTFNQLNDYATLLKNDASNIPCFARAEIAAAVYSYTISRQAEPGIYILFDVGSGTIEGASFRFFRENKMPKIEFYTGEVEPIGMNALAKQVNMRVADIPEFNLEKQLVDNSYLILQNIESLSKQVGLQSPNEPYHVANSVDVGFNGKVTTESIERALRNQPSIEKQMILNLILLGQRRIHRQVAEVVVTCKEKNPEYFKSSSSLRVFLGGGGGISEFYRHTIESTHTAFDHKYAGIPVYDLRDVPFPGQGGTEADKFDMSGIEHSHFHRFSIAYGLSIPDYEASEVTGFPRQFPIVPPPPHQPITPESGRYPDDHSSM